MLSVFALSACQKKAPPPNLAETDNWEATPTEENTGVTEFALEYIVDIGKGHPGVYVGASPVAALCYSLKPEYSELPIKLTADRSVPNYYQGKYVCEVIDSVKNGDKIIINAEYDKDELKKAGYSLKYDNMTIDVNIDEYIDNTNFTDAAFDELYEQTFAGSGIGSGATEDGEKFRKVLKVYIIDFSDSKVWKQENWNDMSVYSGTGYSIITFLTDDRSDTSMAGKGKLRAFSVSDPKKQINGTYSYKKVQFSFWDSMESYDNAVAAKEPLIIAINSPDRESAAKITEVDYHGKYKAE
jgi:hypothetical protein